MEVIQSEVKKLIDSGFIREEQHPDWVANIVSVTKKNEKIRLCIYFHDLNEACPKDEFPFPITDVMIDKTCGFERMSSWTDSLRTIKLKCTLIMRSIHLSGCRWGYICYTIMPFGLKNAGVIYQRAMNAIFHEHIRKTVECYIDDIAIKSHAKGGKDIRKR